ncbi:DUF11 domain-containing protein [Actinophytocola xanthii]|uniref:DUF11 domain-containing protein n=1 Tax=Actinophytocola xanthii TaxID=1912961 RepID=A0A1Q8CLG4_9PSEU|nr:DUF11 domain-containing protein [Actinophytocola xanthii]OLF15184.1 hypothetical protein BU204_23265 [Actinophytocola xanthii]
MNLRHRLGTRTTLLAVLTVLPAVALVSGAASAELPPQLSIAVDNERTEVEPGDTLDYTVTVRNLGATEVKALLVTQTVPTGLRFESADPAGATDADGITWTVALKANGEATVRSRMTVVATPPELLRLATVACARLTGNDPPIVCAAHTAQLPAAASRTASQPAADSGLPVWQIAAGAAALAVATAVAVFLLVRRRRKPGSGTAGRETG